MVEMETPALRATSTMLGALFCLPAIGHPGPHLLEKEGGGQLQKIDRDHVMRAAEVAREPCAVGVEFPTEYCELWPRGARSSAGARLDSLLKDRIRTRARRIPVAPCMRSPDGREPHERNLRMPARPRLDLGTEHWPSSHR